MTPAKRLSAASKWCLADNSVLVNIASARGGAPFPSALSATIIGLWRDLEWPVVHFLPDDAPAAERAFSRRGLIRPGALWFESGTSSIWSCQRFREFHHDTGGAPIVIIGGEIDKTILSVAVGAVERNVPAFYVPETSCILMNKLKKNDAKNAVSYILSSFAVELNVDDLFSSLNERHNGNPDGRDKTNGDVRS